jgi:hypothetical protein
MQHNGRIDVNTVSIDEGKLIDALSLTGQAVQTFGVFDHPCAIFPANRRMETRYTRRWYLYITCRVPPNGEYRFTQAVFAGDFPAHLNKDLCFGGSISLMEQLCSK